jgi:hypothetical protein
VRVFQFITPPPEGAEGAEPVSELSADSSIDGVVHRTRRRYGSAVVGSGVWCPAAYCGRAFVTGHRVLDLRP